MLKTAALGCVIGLMISGTAMAAQVELKAHINQDYDKSKAGFGYFINGEFLTTTEYLDKHVQHDEARCAFWGGVDGHWNPMVIIPAGQDVTITSDDKYPLDEKPTQVFKIVDASGQQIAGLTCTSNDRQPIGTDNVGVRSFLQSLFGNIAGIQ